MREAFEAQLRGLLESIMEMGGLAEGMVDHAMRGLLDGLDGELDRVVEDEDRVNALHLRIDERAVALTVQQQPVARDVRMVFVASRCAADVERVGDQAMNIVGSARHYWDEAIRVEVPGALAELADAARRSLADALAAMVTRDLSLADGVLDREPRLNAHRDDIFKQLLSEMHAWPEVASSALSLLLVSRNLERIGDHATNIARDTIYLVRGCDVRHRS
jgi:phosphate transport system protein